MKNKVKLNFGSFVAAHFKNNLSRPERLSLSHLPTVFAKKMNLLDDKLRMQEEKKDAFDLPSLQRMFHIKKD